MVAKDLKEVLTEDRDLPSLVGLDSAGRDQQARKAADGVAAEKKPGKHEARDHRGDRWWHLESDIPVSVYRLRLQEELAIWLFDNIN